MKTWISVLLASVFSFACLPATADTKDPGDVLGSWSFQTKPYRQGACIMTGRGGALVSASTAPV